MILLVTLAVCALTHLSSAAPRHAPVIDNSHSAMQYMMNFNYLKQSDMDQGVLMSEHTLSEAVLRFQRMANITMSGKLDNETMTKMNQPRCGVADMMFHIDARKKRYSTFGQRWPDNTVSWRVDNTTSDIGSITEVEDIMARALEYWADVSGLTFNKLQRGDPNADIIISFEVRDHGDGNAFDGSGRTLAHAFFPGPNRGGDAHFDDDETFTLRQPSVETSDIDLLQVATHEFGHSLGLGHSEITTAVMAPFYRYNPDFSLHSDDIAGIRSLYGPNVDEPDVTMPPITMPESVPCSGRFDVITLTTGGDAYAFRGDLVFKFLPSGAGVGLEQGFPKKISEVFEGLPDNLDAALYWRNVGRTYFFKGDQYYRFSGTTLDRGYPRPISDWGLPADIDAAFQWSGNGRLYFIKGNQYYRYNPSLRRIDYGYPRPLSVWRGLPARIDAAVQWRNSRTYFFAGEEYFRFHDRNFRVDSSYPQSTVRYWVGCDLQNLVADTTTPDPNGAERLIGALTTTMVLISTIASLLCV